MNSRKSSRLEALEVEAVAYGGVEEGALRGGREKLAESLLGNFEVSIVRSANEGDFQNAVGCRVREGRDAR